MTALQKMLLELGVAPRSVQELTREKHWREKMVPIAELYRRQERTEEFKQLRKQFAALRNVSQRPGIVVISEF